MNIIIFAVILSLLIVVLFIINNQNNLFRAVSINKISKVKALLEKDTDVKAKNNNGITALMFASTKGYSEVVDLLIKNGAKQ